MTHSTEQLKAVDLFAGCGGLSLGFQNAGIEVLAAFEKWQPAIRCYEKNFNHPVYSDDISDVVSVCEKIKAFAPDIIIGGPPCQDFSSAGKRVEASRAGLTESYAEIIKTIRPKYFVMENVPTAVGSNAYAYALDTFMRSGYGLTLAVLDASRCGVPQKRKRLFCIGIQGESNAPPKLLDILNVEKTSREDIVYRSKKNAPEMTLRDYFGDSLGFEYYYRHPRSYKRRGIFSIDEPSATIRGVNRPIPKGYPGNPADACEKNDSIRALTTQERAMIQTFPREYDFLVRENSKTDIEQMIGNAVPVKLAEYVANSLLAYIKSKT